MFRETEFEEVAYKLFKKCFIQLCMGPEEKGFGQEWPFFLGKW